MLFALGLFVQGQSGGGGTTPKSNMTATTDPTVDDDSTEGYSPGSLWYNTVTNVLFVCEDATPGAAVWEVGGSGYYLVRTNNLSDLQNVASARSNLGLGTLAQQNANAAAITGGTIAGTLMVNENVSIETVAIDTVLDGTHGTVLADTTAADIDVTLPESSTCDGRKYNIKKIPAANSMFLLASGSDTIDGETSLEITEENTSVSVQADGDNDRWVIL